MGPRERERSRVYSEPTFSAEREEVEVRRDRSFVGEKVGKSIGLRDSASCGDKDGKRLLKVEGLVRLGD